MICVVSPDPKLVATVTGTVMESVVGLLRLMNVRNVALVGEA